jgi:asparagine synthase (glutamine-hydrolysing)
MTDVECEVDGTIYNAPQLGGGTPAEVVTRLTAEHGFTAAVGMLNGDFAIRLQDRRDGTLWLARDRFGVRPLYHLRDDPSQTAGRPGPLLAIEGVDRTPERSFVARFAASHYRTFDNDPTASPYEAIAQLPAAHVGEVRDGVLTSERYWGLQQAPDNDAPEAELAERYRELLLDAVGKRVAASGRSAFTLSGGMDSSTVLACAVALTGERQHAYSTLYSGSEYDESDEIRTMLDAAVAEWHQVAVDAPDVIARVGEMIEAHHEPIATATWLSHHVLCKEVADAGFQTLFGGLGGDELNAGEYEYFLYRFADLRAAGEEDALRHEVSEWQRHHDHPIFHKNTAVMEAGLERFTDLSQPGFIRPDRSRIERYSAALNREFFDLRDYEHVMDRPFDSYLKNRTYQDLMRETAPCCLRAEDRQTRAHGLRNCDPFFDHRLAEFMFNVGGAHKIRDGVTKRLLREATKGVLPDETRMRIKKTGWNAPADQWFSGAGRAMLHDLVSASDFRAAHVYDVAEVRRLIDEHDEIVRSGRVAENHMMFLWQLVNLELWLRWLHDL